MDLTRRYGDIVQFQIGAFRGCLLSHPEYFRHVLNVNHRNYCKDNYNYNMLKPVLGEGLITADGEHWRHHRGLIQPVFHRRRAASLAHSVIVATDDLLERWQAAAREGQAVDVSADMTHLSLRVVTAWLLGTDMGVSASVVEEAFSILNRDVSDRFKALFTFPFWIPTARNRNFKRAIAALDRLVYDLIARRRRERVARDDLLDALLAPEDQASHGDLTDREVRDEVMTLLLAGHETTANLMTWTCYLLSRHPQTAEALRDEAEAVLGDGDIQLEALPALALGRRVLQESLRLYPPVWIISRRAIHEDVIGGYAIPAGTTVALCSYALHRNPYFWNDPERFNPERFSTDQSTHRHNFAFVPFGGGPRSCIGAHVAMTEAQLVLTRILRRYQLLPNRKAMIEPEPLVTLRPHGGLKLVPRPLGASLTGRTLCKGKLEAGPATARDAAGGAPQ
jgi:cytochrome P450